MNGYTPQSPETRVNTTTPPSISRRLNVTEYSAKLVLVSTDSAYNSHLAELKRIEQSQRQAPVVPMSSSVELQQAPVPAAQPVEPEVSGTNVVRFIDPSTGEVVDRDQKNMIDDANRQLDDIYGQNNPEDTYGIAA